MLQILKGTVIKGESLGKTLGFPTANIKIPSGIVEEGTYKIHIIVNNKVYRGAGSYLPKKGVFESHIFQFDENIYGQEVEVIILEKIRDNIKFQSVQELKVQIHKDLEKIKNIKDYVLTFGTFDHIHLGHQYFLEKAKSYGDRLITIVATDENVKKFKGTLPKNNIKTRINDVRNIGISDMVVEGNKENPMIWLKLYMPTVICLGYDQVGYSEELENYIQEKKLHIKIIRLEPFKADTFKSSIIKKFLS